MKFFSSFFGEAAQEVKTSPSIEELASTYTNAYGNKYFRQYNPDDVLKERGRSISFYENEMGADDRLAGIHDFKIKAIFGTDWDIKSASDDPRDMEIRDFVKDVLDNLEGESFKDVMVNMCDAWKTGHKEAEIVWEERDGMFVFRSIKTKPAGLFDFDVDPFGNLKPNGLLFNSKYSTDPTRLPQEKFIIRVHPSLKDGNWYGHSDYRDIYREWWSKDVLFKWRNIALQVHAMPIREVAFDHVKSTPAQREDMHAIFDKIHENLTIYVPAKRNLETKVLEKLYEVNLIEPKRPIGAEFDNALTDLDTRMSRRLLLGDKLGMTNSDGGSYALGDVQFNIFVSGVIREEHEKTADVFNKQAIERLVRANFSDVEVFPRLKFHEYDESVTKDKVLIIKTGIDAGLINPMEMWVRKYLNFPELEEGMTLPEPKRTTINLPGNLPGMEARVKVYRMKPVKRADYARIEKALDANEQTAVDRMSGIWKAWRDEVVAKAQRIADEGDVKNATVTVKRSIVSDLDNVIELFMLKTYMDGKAEVRDEVRKAQRTNGKYQAYDVRIEGRFARAFEAVKDDLNDADRQAIARIKEKAYYLAGEQSRDVIDQVNRVLLDKVGKSTTAAIAKAVEDIFAPYVETGVIDGRKAEEVSLIRFVRTMSTKVFNEGRINDGEDPALGGFVQAWQYSAILDDTTTDFCESHNGDVVEAGDPRLASYPPAHYNCRSIWEPIFRGEDYDTSWDARHPQPAEGFE